MMKTMMVTTMPAVVCQLLDPIKHHRHAKDSPQQLSLHQREQLLLALRRLCSARHLRPPLLSGLHSPTCKTTISLPSVAVARQP
jgi:hypothetical protein